MARARSKRKGPSREVHANKEQEKIDEGIFDRKTMISLSKFFNKGVASTLGSPIARGKEADLYLAETGPATSKYGTHIVLKFFRVETSSFFKMADYMLGDPRFSKISSSKYSIVLTWCKKEFGNLEIAERAGTPAPKPIMFNGSILAMTFIGDEKSATPSPQLKDAEVEDPESMLNEILEGTARLCSKGLVHGDLSEYNILVNDDKPFFIDFGQAVMLRHPKASEFLYRDVDNILRYFRRKYGIDRNLAAEVKSITSRAPRSHSS